MPAKQKTQVLAVDCVIDLAQLVPFMSEFDLDQVSSLDDITDQHKDTEVLIWNNTFNLNPAMIKPLKRLKYIVNWGTNSNNVSRSISEGQRYKLLLVNDYSIQAVAKYGLDLLVDHHKNQPDAKPVDKLKVGIIGLGKIGFTLADMLTNEGISNIVYSATADKHLDKFKFKSQDYILNNCDFVFILTSSPQPISLAKLNNPKLVLINLCSNDLFKAGELDDALLEGRLAYLLSDTHTLLLKSHNVEFFGHVAYRSPQSIVNKHNKLVYFLKRIHMNKVQVPETAYYVRHGETEWNRDGIYQGRLDSPVTSFGDNQMQRAANYLVDKTIKHVFTSPLPRAKSAAKLIGAAVGVQPKVHGFLREQNFGAMQGMPKAVARQQFAGFFESRRSNEWSKLYTPYPGGGESYYDVYHRIHDPYLELLTKLEGNAVFVAHESINRILRGFARDLEPAEMIDYRQANDEVITLDLASGIETIVQL